MKARLIIVGGFLGAGKTTLLWNSARKLSEQGKNVGLITNDQAAELVDTAFLEYANDAVEEVSGSCFCCNFNGFTDAIAKIIAEKQCEIIIAEPVGSCTDLSATILHPLKEKLIDRVLLSPLSVVIDPDRLSDIIEGGTSGLHKSAAYIVKKQLEEADIILINKSDLINSAKMEFLKNRAAKAWPLAKVFTISSKTGDGLDEWLEEVTSRVDAGTHLIDIDYDTYAEGEAVLGWYNGSVQLIGKATNWNDFISSLMLSLSGRFNQIQAPVGHLKMLLQTEDQYLISNLTGTSPAIAIQGGVHSNEPVKLTINARVEIKPEELESIIRKEIELLCSDSIKHELIASKCLSPGRPAPTYRYSTIL